MEQVFARMKEYHGAYSFRTSTIIGVLMAIAFWLLADNHNSDDSWGALSLLPTLLVLAVALYSRKPFESLLAGTAAGLIMINKDDVISPFSDAMSSVLGDETIVWIILVCGLMGGLITLLELSGCLGSFSSWLQTKIKSRRQSMVTTFLIGLVVFIDDYLN